MPALPVDTRLKVEKAIEDKKIQADRRPYLGLSTIGHPCSRKLWYDFRHVKQQTLSPRLKRLFDRGHREEPVIVKDLIEAGMQVHSDQKEISLCFGHCKGHCDGFIENVPDAPKTTHLGEFKTCSQKYFLQLKKHGLKKVFPVYYAQMVVYMDGFKLKRGLFVAVNKNDDSRYYERVRADSEFAKELKKKALYIVSSENPPTKLSNKSDYYQCKWCAYQGICHFGHEAEQNCRTCKAGDIHDHGVWRCSLHDIELAFSQQLKGCNKHTFLEGLHGK